MILFGFLVFVFLFLTVHHRDMNEITAKSPDRYPKTIMVWIEHGYFKHGGLRFLESVEANPTQEVWRSSSMGFLQAAHLLERINYWLRGNFSYRLMALHNQAIIWFSSALLGMLAMRLALRMNINPLHALFLGIASTSIYQTFPTNLWYYWEIYPTAVLSLFAILFLLMEEVVFGRERVSRWLTVLRGVCVFALVYVEPTNALLFLTAYLFVCAVLSPELLRRWSISKTLIVPATLALGVFALQVLWVRLNYPGIRLVGGEFMFRAGFDGSTQYYAGYTDLITSRLAFKFAPQLAVLTQWWFLFLAGSLSVLGVAWIYLTRLPQLKCAVLVLATALGLYTPFAFMFSQATVIHPYGYDVYLAIPLTLALCAVLPASLERLTKNRGVFVLGATIMAFCYCMVQIRTYAMAFPLPNLPSGW